MLTVLLVTMGYNSDKLSLQPGKYMLLLFLRNELYGRNVLKEIIKWQNISRYIMLTFWSGAPPSPNHQSGEFGCQVSKCVMLFSLKSVVIKPKHKVRNITRVCKGHAFQTRTWLKVEQNLKNGAEVADFLPHTLQHLGADVLAGQDNRTCNLRSKSFDHKATYYVMRAFITTSYMFHCWWKPTYAGN